MIRTFVKITNSFSHLISLFTFSILYCALVPPHQFPLSKHMMLYSSNDLHFLKICFLLLSTQNIFLNIFLNIPLLLKTISFINDTPFWISNLLNLFSDLFSSFFCRLPRLIYLKSTIREELFQFGFSYWLLVHCSYLRPTLI